MPFSDHQSLKHHTMGGFSMVEVFVAMAILAIGLLGLLGMTQMIMRGNDTAGQMTQASNVCQILLEELKDEPYEQLGNSLSADDDLLFGAPGGAIQQELRLNGQGLTDCDYLIQESETVGNDCSGEEVTLCDTQTTPLASSNFQSNPACWDHIQSAGPYLFTRSFVVCRGDEYVSGKHPAVATVTTPNTGDNQFSGEVNCMATAGDPTATVPVPADRPENLACQDNDIVNPGSSSQEKLIKVLCTWRKRDGRCGFVNYSALKTDL